MKAVIDRKALDNEDNIKRVKLLKKINNNNNATISSTMLKI